VQHFAINYGSLESLLAPLSPSHSFFSTLLAREKREKESSSSRDREGIRICAVEKCPLCQSLHLLYVLLYTACDDFAGHENNYLPLLAAKNRKFF
jgi:hypothetical protein